MTAEATLKLYHEIKDKQKNWRRPDFRIFIQDQATAMHFINECSIGLTIAAASGKMTAEDILKLYDEMEKEAKIKFGDGITEKQIVALSRSAAIVRNNHQMIEAYNEVERKREKFVYDKWGDLFTTASMEMQLDEILSEMNEQNDLTMRMFEELTKAVAAKRREIVGLKSTPITMTLGII